MDTTSLQPLFDLIQSAQQGYGALGILGAFSVVAYGLVRIYRLAFLQALLPSWARWDSWGKGLRFGLTFGLAFLGEFLASFAAHTKWYVCLAPAVMAGLGALGIRQVEKSVTGNAQDVLPIKLSDQPTPTKP